MKNVAVIGIVLLFAPLASAQNSTVEVREYTLDVLVGLPGSLVNQQINFSGFALSPSPDLSKSVTWFRVNTHAGLSPTGVASSTYAWTLSVDGTPLTNCGVTRSQGAAQANVEITDNLECRSASYLTGLHTVAFAEPTVNNVDAARRHSVLVRQVDVYNLTHPTGTATLADEVEITFGDQRADFPKNFIDVSLLLILLAILIFALWQGLPLVGVPPTLAIIGLFAINGTFWTFTAGVVLSIAFLWVHFWSGQGTNLFKGFKSDRSPRRPS